MISTQPASDFIVILLNVITSSGSYDHNNHLLWWLMFFLYRVSIVCSLVDIILDGGLSFQYLSYPNFPTVYCLEDCNSSLNLLMALK